MSKITIDNYQYGSGRLTDDEKNVIRLNKNGNYVYKNDIMDDKDLLKQLRCSGYFQPTDMKYKSTFYPFKRIDPYNRVQGTKEYVFFTTPYIPIINNKTLTSQFKEIPYYRDLFERGYIEILQDLSGEVEDGCPFIRMLSNRISSNIDIPGSSVDVMETAQNFWGTKIIYPKTSMSSDENMEFTCEFEETKYLEIYHFFKAWDLYRQMKWWGVIDPPEICIMNKVLNDHIAVYKFIVAEDGETILYWCKWTGVFPSTIGRDTFSEIPVEGPLKITVTFKVSGWFEDMDPNIIADFRQLIGKVINANNQRNRWDIWENDYGAVNQDNMYMPWIEAGSGSRNPYKEIYFEWLEF